MSLLIVFVTYSKVALLPDGPRSATTGIETQIEQDKTHGDRRVERDNDARQHACDSCPRGVPARRIGVRSNGHQRPDRRYDHTRPRVLYGFVYGKDHAYGQPPNGTEDSVGGLTVDDLRRVHTTWLKPNNATLIVVGDTTLEEIVPKLEAVFVGWTRGEVPDKKIGEVAPASRSVIYLMDRPGAVQSVILASQVIPPKGHPDEIATETMIDVLGGSFTARMNMNLREDKHWSYGARSQVSSVRGQRLLTTVAPVQTDKTKEAVFEVVEEHRDITDARPPTADELARVQRRRTLSQSGRWETMGAVSSSIRQLITHALPDDHFQSYPDKLRALDVADVASAATRVIRPDGLTWIVVGDLEQIEAGVRELGLADVYVIDADGNIVR